MIQRCVQCGETIKPNTGACGHCGSLRIVISDDRSVASSSPNPSIPGGFLSLLDKDIIDYEPGRSLSDPAVIEAIQSLIPGCKWVCYAETPFFEMLNELQGTPNIGPSENPILYEQHRNALFNAQVEVDVEIHGLVFTQPDVNKPAIDHLVQQPQGVPHPAFVVRFGAAEYLMDGHHRTIAAFLEGQTMVPARLVDLDRPHTVRKPLPLQPSAPPST